ncbi:hypothetical protein SRHO_G00168530 [Serrasalmus rhombeus]
MSTATVSRPFFFCHQLAPPAVCGRHCLPSKATADAESSQTQPSALSPPVPLPEPQHDRDFCSTPEISGDDAASQSDSPVPLLEPQPDQESSSSNTPDAAPVASSTPQPPPEPEADPASSGQSMLEETLCALLISTDLLHLEVWHLLRADQLHLPRLHRWHFIHLSQHLSCLPPPKVLLRQLQISLCLLRHIKCPLYMSSCSEQQPPCEIHQHSRQGHSWWTGCPKWQGASSLPGGICYPGSLCSGCFTS